jgi:hypothetical protein
MFSFSGMVLLACSAAPSARLDTLARSTAADTTPANPPASPGAPASTCAPGDVSSFKPTWQRPAPHQDACTQVQIDAFYADCLATTATESSCTPFGSTGTAADQACAACLITTDTATALGPIVARAGLVELNVAGCFALTENHLDGSGCSGSVQASEQCSNAACAASCPIGNDSASFEAYQACASSADMGGCATFATASQACAGADTPAANACAKFADFQRGYSDFAKLFCLAR